MNVNVETAENEEFSDGNIRNILSDLAAMTPPPLREQT